MTHGRIVALGPPPWPGVSFQLSGGWRCNAVSRTHRFFLEPANMKKPMRKHPVHPKLGFRVPLDVRTGKPIDLAPKANATWTEEMMIDLLTCWNNKITPAKIAVSMTAKYGRHLSRSAIIGKLSRLGLRTTPDTPPEENKYLKAKKPQQQNPFNTWTRRPRRAASPQLSEHIEVVVPADQRKTLLDLEPEDCRWPIGDPYDDGFHFCAARQVPGSSYCAYHTNAAAFDRVEGVAAPYPQEQELCKRLDSSREELLEDA